MLRRLFHRETPPDGQRAWTNEQPLLSWAPSETWTLGAAFEGTLITGGTGSGKTSGSGRRIATAMLRNGFGGLVLCAKPSERALWEQYCREANRSDDLLVVDAAATWRLNFLDYELNRQGPGAGQTENILNLLTTCLEASERGSGSGRESESYWKNTSRQMCRAAIDLSALARGSIALGDLHKLILSAPTSAERVKSEEWRRSSYCFQCLAEADKRPKTPRQAGDFELTADYWLVEFPNLSEKTRSVIVSTFTSMIDVLARGVMRDLFCTTTTITPDAAEQGKVIVIDIPVKEFGEIGVLAQVIFKYVFQKSIERRDIATSPRPVFLWADEAQHWVNSADMLFQTTCRSARVATVFMTQNVPAVYAALGGGEKATSEAAGLFANMSTKVFHANNDPQTNEWAASIIGKSRQIFASGNTSSSVEEQWPIGLSSGPRSKTASAGFSESYDWEVQPAMFTRLRTGGMANRRLVDAIVFQNGKVFAGTGKTWMPMTIEQPDHSAAQGTRKRRFSLRDLFQKRNGQ